MTTTPFLSRPLARAVDLIRSGRTLSEARAVTRQREADIRAACAAAGVALPEPRPALSEQMVQTTVRVTRAQHAKLQSIPGWSARFRNWVDSL